MRGRITDRDEAGYRREVANLMSWCEDDNLTLNTDKTKEIIVDMRKERRPHQPLIIRELAVERVSPFKYLGVHISEDLTWTVNTTQLKIIYDVVTHLNDDESDNNNMSC